MIQFKIMEEGTLTPWSGPFEDSKEADKWYNQHGVYFENRGYKLVRVESKRIGYNKKPYK